MGSLRNHTSKITLSWLFRWDAYELPAPLRLMFFPPSVFLLNYSFQCPLYDVYLPRVKLEQVWVSWFQSRVILNATTYKEVCIKLSGISFGKNHILMPWTGVTSIVLFRCYTWLALHHREENKSISSGPITLSRPSTTCPDSYLWLTNDKVKPSILSSELARLSRQQKKTIPSNCLSKPPGLEASLTHTTIQQDWEWFLDQSEPAGCIDVSVVALQGAGGKCMSDYTFGNSIQVHVPPTVHSTR